MRYIFYIMLLTIPCLHTYTYDAQSTITLAGACLGVPAIEESCTEAIDAYCDHDTWTKQASVALVAGIGGMYTQMSACTLTSQLAPVDDDFPPFNNITYVHNGIAAIIRAGLHNLGTYCNILRTSDINHNMQLAEDVPLYSISVYCATAASALGISCGMKALRNYIHTTYMQHNTNCNDDTISDRTHVRYTSTIMHIIGACAGHVAFYIACHDA